LDAPVIEINMNRKFQLSLFWYLRNNVFTYLLLNNMFRVVLPPLHKCCWERISA